MNAYALTTVTRLKAFIGIDVTTYDAVFAVIIDAVTDFIENECDRRFKETAYVSQQFSGESSNEVVFPQWPISSSESFEIAYRNAGSFGNESFTAINSNEYRIEYETGIVGLSYKLNTGFLNFKASYTAGYAFDNVTEGSLVPLSEVGLSDLELAVWKLCSRAYANRKGAGNISRMKLYNYDVTFSKEAYSDDEIKEVLTKYKRFTF